MIHFPRSLEAQLVGKSAALLPWMKDEEITDILINGADSFFIDKAGLMQAVSHPIPDKLALQDLVERLLIANGKRVDASIPYADGRLADGSRYHIILPPIAPSGPLISIRKMRDRLKVSLSSFGGVHESARLLAYFREQKNILVCGGTGSGKTTLLSCLLEQAEPTERIAILEENREILTPHPHAVFLEARAASPEGKGEVSMRALVRNCLRMRPDRIVVGEVRGEEAFDLLQAMNTGHRGCLGTLHANSAIDGLKRLETLAILVGYGISHRAIKEWVGASIHAVVHVSRSGACRYINEIATVHGLEGDNYRVLPIFKAKA